MFLAVLQGVAIKVNRFCPKTGKNTLKEQEKYFQTDPEI